jgi:hypothetical protein
MFRRRESISSSAPLNWRRGLFRLWLLASAAWILAWGVYSILSAIAHAFVTPEDVVARAVVFFGPPVALLLCGLAARWALEGFRPNERVQSAPKRPEENIVQLREELPEDYVS